MGWLRTDAQDPETAEVTAWLRTLIAWIGDTCLLVRDDVRVTAPVVTEVDLVATELDPIVTPAGPDAPLRLVAVESAA